MKKFLSLVLVFLLIPAVAWGGVYFDNVDDFVDTNYNPIYSTTDDFSICAWANTDGSASGEEFVFGILDASDVIIQLSIDNASCATSLRPVTYLRDDGGISFDGPVCSDTDMTAGQWHHLCIVYDESDQDLILYMDGSNVGSDLSTGQNGQKNAANQIAFTIGARRQDSGTIADFWDGRISDVAFWRAELTSSEVSLLASSRLRRMPCQVQFSSLEKYFPLDDEPHGTSADGDSFRNECGSDEDSGTGDDGANNTGLTADSTEPLSYPPNE